MPVMDDDLRALGRLTVNFGNLELYLALAIWALLETDGPTSQMVTAELSFRARLNLLSSAARNKLQGEEILESIDRLVREAGAVEQERNGLVHAHFLTGADGSLTRMKYTAKAKGFHTQMEALSTDGLNDVATRVGALAQKFAELSGALLERFNTPWIPRLDGPPV